MLFRSLHVLFLICQSFSNPRLSKAEAKIVHDRSQFCGHSVNCLVIGGVWDSQPNMAAPLPSSDSADVGVRLSTVSAPSIYLPQVHEYSDKLNFFFSLVRSICTRIRQVTLGRSALSPNSSVSSVRYKSTRFFPPVFFAAFPDLFVFLLFRQCL